MNDESKLEKALKKISEKRDLLLEDFSKKRARKLRKKLQNYVNDFNIQMDLNDIKKYTSEIYNLEKYIAQETTKQQAIKYYDKMNNNS